MTSGAARSLGYAVFAAALGLASLLTLGDPRATDQALVWWPTGVAIAGLSLLGPRAVWVVALMSITFRMAWLGNPLPQATLAGLGRASEALAGYALLRRFEVQHDFARLRDTLALLLTAATAPLTSMAIGLLTRVLLPSDGTFYSGWQGWWRMNALAIVAVVPAARCWLAAPGRRAWRAELPAIAFAVAMGGTVLAVLLLAQPGTAGVLLLTIALPIAFFGALQFGDRGAAATALAATLAISLPTAHTAGAFMGIPFEERHLAAQLMMFTLAATPLVLGALLAERQSNAVRSLRSEAFSRTLLQILPDVTYRLRADGTFVDAFVPPGMRSPMSVETLLNRRIEDVFEPRLARRLRRQLQRAHRGEPPDTVEYAMDTAKGQWECEMRFLRLPNGEVLALARDITERKQAVHQLEFQARVLERIAAGSSRHEVFAALVDGMERLLPGCRASILLVAGARLHVACAPSLPYEYNAAISGMEIGPNQGACGSAAHSNTIVVCEDLATDPRWAKVRDLTQRFGLGACWSVPVRSSTGTVLGTLAFYYQSPQRPAHAEIAFAERAATLVGLALDRERREDLLASIQRNVSEGIYRSIPGEGFVHVNQSFARMFGYVSADALQREWQHAEHELHRTDLARLADEALAARHRETRLHRRDGSEFWALVSSAVTFHDDDAELVCDGSVVDITARKQLEDQLRQAQKMEAVGQLAGGVAHDFNNLLTAIRGYAEAVRARVPDGSRERGDVDQILAATDRATGLTRQLLAFGRRQVLMPQVLDLGAVVDELSDMLRRLIGEHIEFVHVASRESVRARADRGQLEQVLLNLVINARDAMPHGGRITVTTRATVFGEHDTRPAPELSPGRHAVLTVADTGAGMTADVRMRAFDPFFTTKEPGKGTGLGLSTVYGIARQSGGTVVIDSEPGAGATIAVYLPFADEIPVGAMPELQPRAPRRKGRVLLVEDEPLVRDLAERALRDAKHDVMVARDGIAALEQLAAHAEPIDVVVTDLVMPRMGGHELARRLQLVRPGVRIVYMTGYADTTPDTSSSEFGFAGLLQKPFTAAELVGTVARCLGQRGADRDDDEPIDDPNGDEPVG